MCLSPHLSRLPSHSSVGLSEIVPLFFFGIIARALQCVQPLGGLQGGVEGGLRFVPCGASAGTSGWCSPPSRSASWAGQCLSFPSPGLPMWAGQIRLLSNTSEPLPSRPLQRCVWCRRPDSAENCGVSTVALLGQVLHSRCCCVWCRMGPTVQRTVDYPQLQLLDKVFFPVVVVSGADGLTVQKTVEYPQLQFQDKVYMTVFGLVPVTRQCRAGQVPGSAGSVECGNFFGRSQTFSCGGSFARAFRECDPNVSVRKIEASFRKRGNSLSENP